MNHKLYKQISEYEPYDEREKIDKEIMLKFIENNEDCLTRDNKIAHFTASAWIVNKERTKILMIYHNVFNSWAWVGGHADGDDDLFHVVNKEIEEETGLISLKPLVEGIYGLNIVTVDNHIKRGIIVNSHLHFDIEYLFEADDEETIRIKEDENSGVKWIDIKEVNNYSTEEKMKPIYSRLTNKLFDLEGKDTFNE